MVLSSKGFDFIASFEGCRLKAYKDSGGIKTIGIGHVVKAGEPEEITKAQALKLFKEDVKKYYPSGDTPQENFDAMTSYRYNCGTGANLNLSARNNHIYDAKGNKLKGLIRRRIAENVLVYEKLYDTTMTPLYNAFGRLKVSNYGYSLSFKYENVLIQWACKLILGLGNDFKIDGYYGSNTVNAVRRLQRALGLTVDGIAGRNTIGGIKKKIKGVY